MRWTRWIARLKSHLPKEEAAVLRGYLLEDTLTPGMQVMDNSVKGRMAECVLKRSDRGSQKDQWI